MPNRNPASGRVAPAEIERTTKEALRDAYRAGFNRARETEEGWDEGTYKDSFHHANVEAPKLLAALRDPGEADAVRREETQGATNSSAVTEVCAEALYWEEVRYREWAKTPWPQFAEGEPYVAARLRKKAKLVLSAAGGASTPDTPKDRALSSTEGSGSC